MARSDPHRPLPILTAGTPIVARADGSLHIGCEPDSALIVRLDPPAAPSAVARLLDELRGPVTRAQLANRIRAAGLTATGFTTLVDRLVAAGKALEPAATAALRVRIHGGGSLARRLASALAQTGIPVVADAAGPGSLTSLRRLDCNLLVLADRLVIDPALRAALMSAATPHLQVGVHDGMGFVGPLVLPGHSSCLACADLYHRELDPHWPLVAARLSTLPEPDDPDDSGHTNGTEHADDPAAGFPGADRPTLALTALLACQEIVGIAGRLADPCGGPPQTVDHRLQVCTRPVGTSLVPAPPHPACSCRQRIPAPAPDRRVHYSRGKRKDSGERRHHTGTRPAQCQAGSTAARHGGSRGGRIR